MGGGRAVRQVGASPVAFVVEGLLSKTEVEEALAVLKERKGEAVAMGEGHTMLNMPFGGQPAALQRVDRVVAQLTVSGGLRAPPPLPHCADGGRRVQRSMQWSRGTVRARGVGRRASRG